MIETCLSEFIMMCGSWTLKTMAERKNSIGLLICQIYHGHEAELCKAWNQKDSILLTWSSSYFRAKIVFALKKIWRIGHYYFSENRTRRKCKKMCTKGVSARFIALISGKKHLQRAVISSSKSLYLKDVDFSGASLWYTAFRKRKNLEKNHTTTKFIVLNWTLLRLTGKFFCLGDSWFMMTN